MKKFFLVATALICLFVNSYAQPGKHNIDKVAAVVGNNIILLSDLNQEYTQYLYQGNPPNESIKCRILQNTLTQKLLKQQAEIDSVMVEDGQVVLEFKLNILLRTLPDGSLSVGDRRMSRY